MFLKFSIACLALTVAGIATFAGVAYIMSGNGAPPIAALPVALAALAVGWLALAD